MATVLTVGVCITAPAYAISESYTPYYGAYAVGEGYASGAASSIIVQAMAPGGNTQVYNSGVTFPTGEYFAGDTTDGRGDSLGSPPVTQASGSVGILNALAYTVNSIATADLDAHELSIYAGDGVTLPVTSLGVSAEAGMWDTLTFSPGNAGAYGTISISFYASIMNGSLGLPGFSIDDGYYAVLGYIDPEVGSYSTTLQSEFQNGTRTGFITASA